MLHPSYVDLMKVVNSNSSDEEPVVQSRYSIVIATAKRAREIIADEKQLDRLPAGKKPLSVAVDELNDGKVKIVTAEQEEEEEFIISDDGFSMGDPEETEEDDEEAEDTEDSEEDDEEE